MEQLLEMLMGQQNKSNLSDIMGQFGLNEDQARRAIGSLLPSVTKGIEKQASAKNPTILEQIAHAEQQAYLDDDNQHVYEKEAIEGGNNILGQILGSKDVSRQVAGQAAEQTGLDSSILKKLLPIVASMAMGAMGKQASAKGLQQNPSGIIDLVSSMLGGSQTQDDGFGLDDIMSIASKFLR